MSKKSRQSSQCKAGSSNSSAAPFDAVWDEIRELLAVMAIDAETESLPDIELGVTSLAQLMARARGMVDVDARPLLPDGLVAVQNYAQSIVQLKPEHATYQRISMMTGDLMNSVLVAQMQLDESLQPARMAAYRASLVAAGHTVVETPGGGFRSLPAGDTRSDDELFTKGMAILRPA